MPDEVAWLVERGAGDGWLGLESCYGMTAWQWVPANAAVRFARQADAVAMILYLVDHGFRGLKLRATEHVWCAPPAAPCPDCGKGEA
jgi:hypothetical protein